MEKTMEVYGLYDGNFNLAFPDAISMKASVREEAKLMEHPMEDGATIADHRVILPVGIELVVFLPAESYKDSYNCLRQAFRGEELYTVHLATGIYSRMALQAMPHEETPDQSDAIAITLSLKEARIITTQYQALPPVKVKSPKDTCTVERGEQQPQPPAQIKTIALNMSGIKGQGAKKLSNAWGK
ncbi:hypothetical protein FHU10_5149 [Serratia fonticola]|jgi:hypothetical protein|uniref:Dit-like phage tail protein N-terminal domain-containing protein n=1 Tax=Serratia fonticola TaxID=47917 RepID=A0A542BN30_SERFO|nr:hypothetical protein [Serratia fonticola]TQI80000.1 hypothetical protein FHU09_2555 [Serratia fonticola]TQI97974.1 hypothetical protein FHU11_3491 [Serratia fonticola]TVZ72469.1 hypothetical protein FHU10_5149 [Serratia fonticola]